MAECEIGIWIIRGLIILAGILALIRLNKITLVLKKKHPKLYKKLGKPGVYTWNFKRGFIAVFNLEKKIVLKDKSLPKEIHHMSRFLRLGLIAALLALMIFVILSIIMGLASLA